MIKQIIKNVKVIEGMNEEEVQVLGEKLQKDFYPQIIRDKSFIYDNGENALVFNFHPSVSGVIGEGYFEMIIEKLKKYPETDGFYFDVDDSKNIKLVVILK